MARDVLAEVEARLWPLVDRVMAARHLPGMAVGVVADGAVVAARGFGVADLGGGGPVTEHSLFHVASVSKPFVAMAALRLVDAGVLDLDAPVSRYLPYVRVGGAHADVITTRHLLTHTVGIPDVEDYRWHEPEVDDGALERFVRTLADVDALHPPGERFEYCNAGYEVAGAVVAKVSGRTFERCLAEEVLAPLGMPTSTFLARSVPPELATGPHLGAPPHRIPGTYPYHRGHAPSSTLHSSAVELCQAAIALLNEAPDATTGAPFLSAASREAMWRPQLATGWSDRAGSMATGWFVGTYRGHRVVSHEGEDPGFNAYWALLPDVRGAVVVLANANTAPVLGLGDAALDVVLGVEQEVDPAVLRIPITVPVGSAIADGGVDAGIEAYRRHADDDGYDASPDAFMESVWGAVEMYETEAVRPMLDVWRAVQPEDAQMWAALGWADLQDGNLVDARQHLTRSLELDPDDDEARAFLRRLERM
ncbi:beta-lactamase [Beutenbergia cavernae DSM 12333]|uniref:Beta-lactamase n=2 Tax=Beutenbergia TaxID=84756 RepID=C5C3S5_BEUC1|nr:beta-lactamase [Beutenbergia cavernae DSM 12333]